MINATERSRKMLHAVSDRCRVSLRLVLSILIVSAASVTFAQDSQLAALRRATAAFHDIDVAMAAGWSEEITGCRESSEGGMGYHFANFDVLLDAELDPLRPEAMLYEPRPNGDLRLVAVEYVIPEGFLPRTAEPPVVLGRELHFSEANLAWILHVWLWRHNPSGMFADWNPRVSCDSAY